MSVDDAEAKDQLWTAPGETAVITFSDGGSTPPASTIKIHNFEDYSVLLEKTSSLLTYLFIMLSQ